MRKKVLVVIAGLLYYSGLVALVRWWTRQASSRLVILNYHTASGGNFSQHVHYLNKHYRIMHIEAALEDLYAVRKNIPRHSVDRRIPLVITLDDGYVDNYTHARKVAQHYHIPLSIYLIPGYIESGNHYWWLEGKRLARQTCISQVELAGRVFDLTQKEQRGMLAQYIDMLARHSSSVADREAFLEMARHTLNVSTDSDERDGNLGQLPMSWAQILEMDKEGCISYGAHTMNHPILAFIANPVEMRYEIAACRQMLEEKLGHPVRTFAYPIGQRQHIDASVVQAVRDAGYSWALTTTYGHNTPLTNPYRLRRIEADVDQHWLVVAVEAAGLWGFFARLRWLPFIRKNFTNSNRAKGL